MPHSEPEYEHEGSEPLPEDDLEPGYPEPIAYDPGAALVDENQHYGAVEETQPDPNPPEVEHPYEAYGSSGDPYAPSEGRGVYDEAPAPPLAPPPTRSAAPKKKAPARAPQRLPVKGKPTPATTRRPVQRPVYKEGISVMTVFLTLLALGMLAGVAMALLPKDMSAVGGYQTNLIAGAKARNLLAEAQKLMIERNTDLTFSEEELNRYLNQRLAGEQKGTMAALVKFRGIYVDLAPGTAEVVIERELFGMPLTTSVTMAGEEFRRQTIYKPTAWNIGRISLGARTVKPVVDLFIRLRGSLLDEYHTLQQMTGVRFEDNRVVLDATI